MLVTSIHHLTTHHHDIATLAIYNHLEFVRALMTPRYHKISCDITTSIQLLPLYLFLCNCVIIHSLPWFHEMTHIITRDVISLFHHLQVRWAFIMKQPRKTPVFNFLHNKCCDIFMMIYKTWTLQIQHREATWCNCILSTLEVQFPYLCKKIQWRWTYTTHFHSMPNWSDVPWAWCCATTPLI